MRFTRVKILPSPFLTLPAKKSAQVENCDSRARGGGVSFLFQSSPAKTGFALDLFNSFKSKL